MAGPPNILGQSLSFRQSSRGREGSEASLGLLSHAARNAGNTWLGRPTFWGSLYPSGRALEAGKAPRPHWAYCPTPLVMPETLGWAAQHFGAVFILPAEL